MGRLGVAVALVTQGRRLVRYGWRSKLPDTDQHGHFVILHDGRAYQGPHGFHGSSPPREIWVACDRVVEFAPTEGDGT